MQTRHTETWRYGAMKAVLKLVDRLIHIEVSGMVGLGDLGLMRRDAVISMALPGALGMIVDFRRASVLVGRAQLPMQVTPIPAPLAAMPVAIVCSEVDEELFLTHAMRQALEGLTRAVFTDADEASSWVLARAGGSSVWG